MDKRIQVLRQRAALLSIFIFGALILASCASASPAAPSQASEETEQPGEVIIATEEPVATEVPFTPPPAATATSAGLPTAAPAVTTPVVESRYVEVEWPARMRLGDSDTVRLSLVPSSGGYTLQAEFPEHTLQVQDLDVARPEGYELFAVASLNGLGFDISPAGDQPSYLPVDDGISWHWSLKPSQPGQQRLTISLKLRWEPVAGSLGTVREASVYSKSLDVQVSSFFGLTRAQAMAGGLLGLMMGAVVTMGSLAGFLIKQPATIREETPNAGLQIEMPADVHLSAEDRTLLSTLFRSYSRISLEREFLSGYSGARTFLVLPIRPDGRADAPTIAKLGSRHSIEREYHSYEQYVKDRLPPVTARIQHSPVSVRSRYTSAVSKAAIRYTFIAEPGKMPVSLGASLRQDPDPGLLEKLFVTFGPNWWLQRSPYTFRLAHEYDRMLPAHLVIEPGGGPGPTLDGRNPAGGVHLSPGDRVTLQHFSIVERRPDGQSLSLHGESPTGQAPARIRWLSLKNPNGMTGRVVATRESLLKNWTGGMDLLGLPDPIPALPGLLQNTLTASRSVIHGDLNLENVLVGTGGFVWLIDFAMTREGHPPFDFAHLEADLIAHVIAPKVESPRSFLDLYSGNPNPENTSYSALLQTISGILTRCLVDPSDPDEAFLARICACLGALKFANLDDRARHYLYLAAAWNFHCYGERYPQN